MLKIKDFIQKLNQIEEVPQDSLLVTLNVKSLYINIPNDEGIKAVKEVYDKRPDKTVSTKVITSFLSLILTLNNFISNSVNYIQKMGCAMGTICAPSYANLFMAQLEEKHIYPHIKGIALSYLRYIDDIFIIWKGTKEQSITFINELNKNHKTIKFEYEISSQKIPFLDTMVYKEKENNLQTTLYRKPTDQQFYLHAK